MSTEPPAGRVILGVSGGIAAYKACEVASRLTQAGCAVRVVMTEAARRFVGPLSFAALTGFPVPDDMFDPAQETTIGHIELARWAQVVAVAPATADLLARAALGRGDDLLSTVLLATQAPVVMAPAMNPAMWSHPAVQANARTLTERGVRLLGPAPGRTACGEEGAGRMVEPGEIVEVVQGLLAPQDLAGVKILVNAGPTREHLDPVRFISNPSTGRMGIAVARSAARRGAAVTLVLGPTHLGAPAGVKVERVVSAAEMHQVMVAAALEAQVIVGTAAVSDFRPQDCSPQKVKKGGRIDDTCRLVGTADILAELAAMKADRILVGFAAETEDILDNARAKLARKHLDLLVANDVSAPDSGFAVETNRVHFLHPDGRDEEMPLMSKSQVAEALLDRVAGLLGRG